MAVRNYRELGENLQQIMVRLLANDNLVKLLYYTDANPLSHDNLTSEQKQNLIFNKLIRIIPKVDAAENETSLIAIRVDQSAPSDNAEFKDISIEIESFVPWNQWMIVGTNLRPFAIMGEIQASLTGKTVNGLGKMAGGDFDLSYLTKEISCYAQHFSITSYD